MGKLAMQIRQDNITKPIVDVYLLLDVSRSMLSDGRLDSLNTSLKELLRGLPKQAKKENIDVFINILTFGDKTTWITENHKISETKLDWNDIKPDELELVTSLGAGLKETYDKIKSSDIKGHRAPVVLVITDGVATDSKVFDDTLKLYLSKEMINKTIRASILVGSDTDSSLFNDFVSEPTNLYTTKRKLTTIVQMICTRCISSSSNSVSLTRNDITTGGKYGLL